MKTTRFLPIAVALLLGAGEVSAQTAGAQVSPDGEWIAYRDAYMQMIRFEKYGKPKQLIQSHYQVLPRSPGATLEGVRLALAAGSGRLELPLDAAGRVVFPLLKSAYDENARLVLNRPGDAYMFQQRISIAPRADGIYDAAELRSACEQALNYLRYVGKPGTQNAQCAGVRFSYPVDAANPVVKVRSDASQSVIPVAGGGAFVDEAVPGFKIAEYRFVGGEERAQIVTQSQPVAIAPVFK